MGGLEVKDEAQNKRQREEIEDKDEGERNKGEKEGYLSLSGTKYCLLIETRQARHRRKWQFMKENGKPVLG